MSLHWQAPASLRNLILYGAFFCQLSIPLSTLLCMCARAGHDDNIRNDLSERTFNNENTHIAAQATTNRHSTTNHNSTITNIYTCSERANDTRAGSSALSNNMLCSHSAGKTSNREREVSQEENDSEVNQKFIEFVGSFHNAMRLAKDKREQEKILADAVRNLSNNRAVMAAYAGAILQFPGISLGLEDKRVLTELKGSTYENKCAKWLGIVTAAWGRAIVGHYEWGVESCSFLERLAHVAQNHPKWENAVKHINATMIVRHDAALMGGGSDHPVGFGPGLEYRPRNPFLQRDLTEVRSLTVGKKIGNRAFTRLEDAELDAKISQWILPNTTVIRLSNDKLLFFSPPVGEQMLFEMNLLRFDRFGLLVPRYPPSDEGTGRESANEQQSGNTPVQREVVMEDQTPVPDESPAQMVSSETEEVKVFCEPTSLGKSTATFEDAEVLILSRECFDKRRQDGYKFRYRLVLLGPQPISTQTSFIRLVDDDDCV